MAVACHSPHKKINKAFVILLAIFLSFFVFFGLPSVTNAGVPGEVEPVVPPDQTGSELLSTSTKDLVKDLNRLGTTSPQVLIGRLIRIAMGIIGSVSLVMFVAGGIMWMTSRGNSERTALATKTLVWSSLGLVVILASYAIVSFLFQAVG